MSILKLHWAVKWTAVAALGGVGIVLLQAPLHGAESAVVLAPPALDNPKAAGVAQTAVLAGGCFWGVQGVFEHVRGVQKVEAGYATIAQPAVERTSVPVRYDPYDAGTAFAYVGNRWVACYSEHFSAFHGRSEREMMIAAAELHKRYRDHSRQLKLTGP